MNRFDTFCNLILEVYGKRMDIPVDGRTAPDRYNNPGGAYPKQSFEKFGMEGYGIIGGGHPIAKYPNLSSGIAANIEHLRSMPVVGKTVGQARYYWVNGNFGGSEPISGMDNDQVITAELLNDPNWLAKWMRGTAKDEGFNSSGRTIDDASFEQAMGILQNKSNFQPSAQYASTGNDSVQQSSNGSENTPAPESELSKMKNYALGLLSANNFDISKSKEALKQTTGSLLNLVRGDKNV